MTGIKKTKLQRIKWLLLISQVVLLLFTAQWMVSQYNDQQAQLKKNLVKLFTDVQRNIADSLVLAHIEPAFINKAAAIKEPGQCCETDSDAYTNVALSSQGIHRLLSGTPISKADEKRLFNLDTTIFNEMFISEMKHNGWNFQSEWINSTDSNSKGQRAIFIQSNFFTNANGIVIDNYNWYLLGKLLPQLCFVLILLVLTGAASWITYRSLQAQIKLSQLKDDFISNMSHELKTPIATVKVALEALNNYNVIDNPKVNREYLGMATAEMDRLELLATRVLNTSLLETGKMYLQKESYDLKKLVDEVVQNMQLRLQQHNATISFRSSGNNFLIPVDKLHTQGVLVNLLDNSLKYGVSPVHIQIDLTESNGAVKLTLCDNGPGIPEEYREKVFEKFFRVPTGNRHNTKGYGLGLSYAAQVMRQHNGSINVNNVAEGGCMFTLTF
ncbi:MAG: sensor histidine kinase [Flavipsychrobacter sp.]|nr:sensor histidine kinase [Flavipsychrobacter sp.]